MFDASTKKRLYFAGCVVTQVFCIAALVLQGMLLKEIYDAKHSLESEELDLTGKGGLTQICLLISVIAFGSLKQLLVWPGLICDNFSLMAGAGLLDCLCAILSVPLYFTYRDHTILSALSAPIASIFGNISSFTLLGVTNSTNMSGNEMNFKLILKDTESNREKVEIYKQLATSEVHKRKH